MAEESTKIYVIDASFVLAFLLPDEHDKQVVKIFEQFISGKINFIAPLILPFEVINSLKNAIPKRVNPQNAQLLIKDFLEYRIEFMEVNLKEVLDLSLDKGLSIYDASYLYLSKSQNLPLLTLDKHLLPFSAS